MEFVLVILLLLSSFIQSTTIYEKVLIPQKGEYSKNSCIDGSPQSIYVKQDMSQVDKKKIMIYFNGGGWASVDDGGAMGVIEAAYIRSFEKRGSSDLQEKTLGKNGIFESSQKLNPAFHDYQVVKIQMCDSMGYQGHIEEPIVYNRKLLWFRGKENALAVLQYLKDNYDLGEAETVIVTGSSAGAQAAAYWLDYIAFDLKKINPQINVLGVIGNGLFRYDFYHHGKNSYSFDDKMRQMSELVNYDSDPIQEACVKANPEKKYRCLSFQENYQYIETPLILVQSNIDAYWEYLIGAGCLGAQQTFMEECQHDQLQNSIVNSNSLNFNVLVSRMMNVKKNMSAYIINQRVHTFIGDNKYYNKKARGVRDNVYKFNDENDNEEYQANFQDYTAATAIQKFVELQLSQSQEEKQKKIPAKQIRLIDREYDLDYIESPRGIMYYIIKSLAFIILMVIVIFYGFMYKYSQKQIKLINGQYQQQTKDNNQNVQNNIQQDKGDGQKIDIKSDIKLVSPLQNTQNQLQKILKEQGQQMVIQQEIELQILKNLV